MSNFDIRNSVSAGYKKQLPQLMSNAGINYKPISQNYADYQGHPWTKMYDAIVPEADFEKPGIQDLDYYAKNFGIDTSVAKLQKKFDDATRAEYAQKNKEFQTSEDQYYQNMVAQNAQYQQGAQNAISQALAAGASRGMQFANQFAAQNELAEDNSTGALDLATQRNNLKAQEAEAYAQNAINAEQTAYDRRANILTQAVADRANEVQRYAADTALYSNELAQRILNYQYNMTNEFNRFENDKDRELDWNKSLLNATVDTYTEHLRDYYNRENAFLQDEYNYAALANQRAIQQMQRQAYKDDPEDTVARTEIVEEYYDALHNKDSARIAELQHAYPFLETTKAIADQNVSDVKAQAKESGAPVAYTSVLGNPRYAMPDGTTLSKKEYEEWLKKDKAQKEKEAQEFRDKLNTPAGAYYGAKREI